MEATTQHEAAERTMRALLEDNGLPAPDAVEYRERSVELYWNESRTVVVIDLDDDGEGAP